MTTVRASFALDVPGTIDALMLVLPASSVDAEIAMSLTLDSVPLDTTTEIGLHGTRGVRFQSPPGVLECTVEATVTGMACEFLDDSNPLDYLGSSQYVPVEELQAFARERFGRARDWNAVDAVRKWVARNIDYDMYRSAIDDDAASTMRKGGGMCRDFAHVTIGLCRALGIPARYVAVFAPGLTPPDFHAVAEVFVDDAWWVLDATGLAPRTAMIRIATGVDAGETAWLTNTGATITLRSLTVAAIADVDLGSDDPSERVQLA